MKRRLLYLLKTAVISQTKQKYCIIILTNWFSSVTGKMQVLEIRRLLTTLVALKKKKSGPRSPPLPPPTAITVILTASPNPYSSIAKRGIYKSKPQDKEKNYFKHLKITWKEFVHSFFEQAYTYFLTSQVLLGWGTVIQIRRTRLLNLFHVMAHVQHDNTETNHLPGCSWHLRPFGQSSVLRTWVSQHTMEFYALTRFNVRHSSYPWKTDSQET